MPPRKLTAEEQHLIDHWSQKAVYFMKKIRRASVYLQTIPRERYHAAYKEFTSSGQVVGGDWNNLDRSDRRRWEPKPEERDAYFQYVESVMESNNPPTSPIKAVTTIFAGNGAILTINRMVFAEMPGRAHDQYCTEFNRLNNEDLFAVYGPPESRPGRAKDAIVKDPDENPSNEPFVRARPHPRDPTNKISATNWKQFEKVGETYFLINTDDTTGFSAFQLTGILMLTTGLFYNVRFEETVDSIRMSEQDLLNLISDGFWS